VVTSSDSYEPEVAHESYNGMITNRPLLLRILISIFTISTESDIWKTLPELDDFMVRIDSNVLNFSGKCVEMDQVFYQLGLNTGQTEQGTRALHNTKGMSNPTNERSHLAIKTAAEEYYGIHIRSPQKMPYWERYPYQKMRMMQTDFELLS